mgnify:CR=1 FL=1
MKMKKMLALVLAGTMLASMALVAQADTITETDPETGETVTREVEGVDSSTLSSSSVSGNSAPAQSESEKRAAAESRAEALAAEAIGIPLTTIYAARAEGKELGEYISNSVYKVAGIDDVTPVAQGGNVIIDGQATNITFTVDKAYYAYTKPAQEQAAAVGGVAINVVDVKAPVRFSNAEVNFYTPGVTADQNIQIFQSVNGAWVSVDVKEVRADHVVANLTAPGVLVFVKVQ